MKLNIFPQTFPTWLLLFWFTIGLLLRHFDTSITVFTVDTNNTSPLSIHLRSNNPKIPTLQNISLEFIWMLSIYLTFLPGHLGRNLAVRRTLIMISHNIAITFGKLKEFSIYITKYFLFSSNYFVFSTYGLMRKVILVMIL